MNSYKKYTVFLLILISITLLFHSCHLINTDFHKPDVEPTIKYKLRIDDCIEKEATAEIQRQIINRLQENRIFYQKVEIDSINEMLLVNVIGFEDETRSIEALRTIFSKGLTMKIISAVRYSDPNVSVVLDSLKNNEELIQRLVFNTGNLPQAVLAEFDQKDLPFLNKFLKEYEQKLDITFVWGRNNYSNQSADDLLEFSLYAFHKSDRKQIETSHLIQTNAEESRMGGFQILVKMNPKGAKIFSEMTLTAANAGNRELLIILGEEVISAPRVNDQIFGGNALISGNYEQKEAEFLARQLMQESLICKIEIVSEETVNPERN